MVQRGVQHREQRTVIIGAGAMGLAVIRAFRRRLAQRWGDLPIVACLVIVGKGEADSDGDLPIVSLPIKAGAVTRSEAREALRSAGPSVIAALVEALNQVSRISQRETFRPGRWSVNWPEEVAFYVVAALDDPLGGGTFLDLAYLARYLASQRLNAPAGLTGLLLLPDALNTEDPQPALARAYTALQELDAWMEPQNGYTVQWSDQLEIQGWGPAFDRGCYLLGALNIEGLGLEKPEERVEFVAEALLQLAVSPLGARCESLLAPSWIMGERPHNYGTLGLAAWVYPSQALAEVLARRLAGELLSAWLDDDAGKPSVSPEAFLAGCNLGPADVAEALLPAELLREAGLWRPLTPRLSPARIKRLRQDLEDEAVKRLESLAARRSDLDCQAEALGKELTRKLAQAVTQRLDLAAPGRLAEARAFLIEVEQHLARLRSETEQAADAHWRELEALDTELERVEEEMDGLTARFPELNWRAILAILSSPRRLLGLFLAYRDLARAGATYGTLLARQMAVATEVLRRDLVVEAYEEALKGVQDQRAQVASLEGAIRAAQQSFVPIQRDLYGPLGLGLERSVLTPESVEALYASVRGDLTDLLAGMAQVHGPLSAWLKAGSNSDVIATACLDYTRRRCRELDQITVEELLMASLGDAKARAEALRGLVELASPFLGWDETRLRGVEHQTLRLCTALGLSEGIASPLLEGLGEVPWAQVVATGESQRVTALTVVQGLPLAALAGLEEYAAAYYAADLENPTTGVESIERKGEDVP